MNFALFDNGGTLIFDPFDDCLKKLCDIVKSAEIDIPIPHDNIDYYFDLWREENYNYDFPFASHFLQEEVWINRASLRFANTLDFGPILSMNPIIAPLLLKEYRLLAKNTLRTNLK